MTSAIARFVSFIVHFLLFTFYKGFAFNCFVEGPSIGFAGRQPMRVKMKAEYGMTETFRCNAGMRGKTEHFGENGICPF